MEEIKSFRHNVMEVLSVSAFAGVNGGVNGGCKDVYFIRLLGVDSSLSGEVSQMDEKLCRRMREGKGVYRRITGLPRLTLVEDAGFYAECYDRWLEGAKEQVHTKNLKDVSLQRRLARALQETIGQFENGRRQENGSMEKNFAVKLLYWFDFVTEGLSAWLAAQWDAAWSAKIVAQNIVKKQEYLFFYLLTLMGFDVLLLECEADIAEDDRRQGLSKEHVLGTFSACSFSACEAGRKEEARDLQAAHRPGNGGPVTVYSTAAAKSAQPGAGSMVRVQMPERERRTSRTPSREEQEPVRVQMPERERRTSRTPSREEQGPVRVQMPERERRTSRTPSREEQGPVRVRMPERARPSTAQPGARREKTFEELARLASSVVLIAIHDGRGDVVGTGSGIMIGSDGYLLTNHHVASGGRYYSVRVEEDENVYRTDEIIKYNSVLDLAVIRISRRLNPIPVYRGADKPVRGQKVVAIGSPLGLFNSVSDGIISGFRTMDGVDMIQFTAPISHGSSGGAVLNMYGEVIGISTAGMDAGQNLNLAVGYESINLFIKGFV